jgi:hypothetical protein
MYLILQPNSLTNLSDQYRVVFSRDWVKYTNGSATTYPFTAHDTYVSAVQDRDQRNEQLR